MSLRLVLALLLLPALAFVQPAVSTRTHITGGLAELRRIHTPNDVERLDAVLLRSGERARHSRTRWWRVSAASCRRSACG